MSCDLEITDPQNSEGVAVLLRHQAYDADLIQVSGLLG